MSERLRALDERMFAKSGGPLFAPIVADDEWISEPAAASRLGMSVRRLRAGPLAVGALTYARTASGELGVLRASLDDERRWRETATGPARLVRAIRTFVCWFPLPPY